VGKCHAYSPVEPALFRADENERMNGLFGIAAIAGLYIINKK